VRRERPGLKFGGWGIEGEDTAMKSLLTATSLLICLAGTSPVNAQQQVFKRGADLHEALQQDGPQASNALNYIIGVVDAANGLRSADGFCFDLKAENVTGAQIAQVVRAFLVKSSLMKEHKGSSVVSAALGEAWPCR
jgi:hypothetical protein